MLTLEQATENERVQEIKQIFRPWGRDPVLTATEELPTAKAIKKLGKRLAELKGRLELWAQGGDGSAERLEATRQELLSRRESLKSMRQKSVEAWADAFLAGVAEPEGAELERLSEIVEINNALRGCNAVEGRLAGVRAKADECRETIRSVEREVETFEEAERLTRESRDELMKISPFDDQAVDRIELLKMVVRKFESRRRSIAPEALAGKLDEVETTLTNNQ